MRGFIKNLVMILILTLYAFWASTFSHMVSMGHQSSQHENMHHGDYTEESSSDKSCKQTCNYIEQNKVFSIIAQPLARSVYHTYIEFPIVLFTHAFLVSEFHKNLHLPSWIPIVLNPSLHHIESTILLI